MELIPKAPIQVPVNPTDAQRHEMLKEALVKAGRTEDYEHLIKNLNPPMDITTYAAPGQYKGIKVAVVGAGLAGLAAAFELRKLGFDITILESEDERTGGRIYTHYFDRDKNLYGELGAGRIPASHGTAWHYVNLFNLNTTRFPKPPDTFVYVKGVRARKNSKDIMEKIYTLFDLTPEERNTPWPKLYEQVVDSAIKSLSPELRAEILQIKPEYSPEFLNIVAISVYQAIKESGLSDEAVRLITSLIPTVNAFINGSFYTEFQSEYALSFRDLYMVDGGMANLPLAFIKSLSSANPPEYNQPKSTLGKVTMKLGCWVTRCQKSHEDEKVVLKYLTKKMPEGTFESFDYVFFAVPLASLRKMTFFPAFSDLKMQAFREAFYIDAQKTLFLCSRQFWEKQGIRGGASNTDLIIQSVIYPPGLPCCQEDVSDESPEYAPNDSGVLTASYNIGNDAIRLGNTRTFRFQLLKRQVELVHGLPEYYLDDIVKDHITVDWNSNEWITGAFLTPLPGQGAQFAFPLSRPEYENRVYFAGEGTFPPHGWIQAALRSAVIASNALAYYLKNHGDK